jgi:hypothetical protein
MNIQEFAQSRIDIEKAASKITRLFYQYRSVHWSPENIRTHTGIDDEKINAAIRWLQKKRYVGGREQFFLTDSGIEFVEGMSVNPSSSSSANSERKFKTEALLGLSESKSRVSGYMVSEQSRLTTAVIPGANRPVTSKTPEDIMADRQYSMHVRAALSGRFKISTDELEEYFKTGRIQYCKSCGAFEYFDRKGARWHSVCRKCRKRFGR